MKTGTLIGLNVKAGDVVECVSGGVNCALGGEYTVSDDMKVNGFKVSGCDISTFRIVSRAADTPTLWRDMADAEKGALLLARHEGCDYEMMIGGEWFNGHGIFATNVAYRIKPTPKVETVTLENDRNGGWSFYEDSGTYKNTHHITFNLIDGKPDTASIKMEEL